MEFLHKLRINSESEKKMWVKFLKIATAYVKQSNTALARGTVVTWSRCLTTLTARLNGIYILNTRKIVKGGK